MTTPHLMLTCRAEPLVRAIQSLTEVAQRAPEAVEGFLQVGDLTAHLVRVDVERLAAVGTGEARIAFKPSDALRKFLAAHGAGDINAL